MGVMYLGVMRADPSWCLPDLDARQRSVGLIGFGLIGASSLLPFARWNLQCVDSVEFPDAYKY